MIGFSEAQVAIAAGCALMAMVHAGLWLAARRDRVQIWTAIAWLAIAGLNFTIAATSDRSEMRFGPPAVWLAVGAAIPLVLFVSVLLSGWHLVGARVGRARKAVLVAAALVGVARAIDIWQFLAMLVAGGHLLSFERCFDCMETATVLPGWATSVFVAGAFVRSTLREVGRRSLVRTFVVAGAAATGGILLRELLITTGFAGGSSWLGMFVVPAMLVGSGVAIARWRDALRGRVRRPEEVAGYSLIRRIAAGGMGECFLAARVGPGGFLRHVALKRVLEGGAADATSRLLQEAALAARLQHPGIVSVYDLGRVDGGWFMVMEYVPGVSGHDLVRRVAELRIQIPAEVALEIVQRVCRALAYAHAQGVVHRDVSPANVMVGFEGEVKLIDFGIAASRGTSSDPDGMVFGKPEYMSPERLAGGPGTPESDVYAAGVVLYQLLTLRRPYEALDVAQLARKALEGKFERADALRSRVPVKVDDVLASALAPTPSQRYASAQEMADAIAAIAAKLPRADVGRFVRETCDVDYRRARAEARIDGRETPTAETVPVAVAA